MRFAFGTVRAVTPPETCLLTDIDAGATVLFRVKVVDEAGEVGRILASANGIRPEDDSDGDDRRPLLPVRTADLAEEIWQLEIDKDAGPSLVVNSRVPDLIERLKRDAFLQGAIYPEVVRRLAREVLRENDDFDDEDEWVGDWLTWFSAQLGRDVSEESMDADAVDSLADDIAAAFAEKNRFASSVIAALQSAA
ncbi:hypothetical protein N5B55_00040 [Ralstonia pickettii]|uniref:hypothetical protein n=1 Tax=Ralstonia pickettii TaxID=329 RepID=UPI002715526F|nr:hypothetical protein [Ralstonia pickettii]WKZ85381.1 hypothetical protein N5B55_00040 [Ralstonia pickettii]